MPDRAKAPQDPAQLQGEGAMTQAATAFVELRRVGQDHVAFQDVSRRERTHTLCFGMFHPITNDARQAGIHSRSAIPLRRQRLEPTRRRNPAVGRVNDSTLSVFVSAWIVHALCMSCTSKNPS